MFAYGIVITLFYEKMAEKIKAEPFCIYIFKEKEEFAINSSKA